MKKVRAVKYKGTGVKPKNQSNRYKNSFLMKKGPAQKQKVKGVKVKPKRRL